MRVARGQTRRPGPGGGGNVLMAAQKKKKGSTDQFEIVFHVAEIDARGDTLQQDRA